MKSKISKHLVESVLDFVSSQVMTPKEGMKILKKLSKFSKIELSVLETVLGMVHARTIEVKQAMEFFK